MKIDKCHIDAGPGHAKDQKQAAAVLLSVVEDLVEKINNLEKENLELKNENNNLKGGQAPAGRKKAKETRKQRRRG